MNLASTQPAPDDDAPDAEPGGAAAAPAPERPVRPTLGQFLRAELLACVLFFLLLALFAVIGLGRLSFVPSLVVAVSATARLTGIRHMPSLMAIGLLAFVVVPTVSILIGVLLLATV